MKYKTDWTNKTEINREWHIVDVKDQILGRVATKIASLLIGKEKVNIVPNVDGGDFVIVLNSDNVKLTRGKGSKKVYYKHSGYPGGLKEIVFDDQMKKDSTRVILLAVKNMLPKNKLRDGRMSRLFVYKGGEHKQAAQNPKEYKL
ncbi:MAG: 50S ribosomal protein L13 [candidate division WS6 bacterium GW2011_GWE1_34_7]|uniref:Large ribosomal subunit protein uL13 n=1 Tax=candidate division WS6 bacterium GW2011_GWE1_34_7 TaxID=1619093 RepID=A0A0G0E959_9BACT|nr:MAG: 50S ribosomal protein L13 [candidate division WS6 bacterium GW2011_GWE1_34_7]